MAAGDNFELNIYVTRVLFVLDETIKRISLIGLLSNFQDHPEAVNHVSKQDKKSIERILKKYEYDPDAKSIATLDIPNLPITTRKSDFILEEEEGDSELHRILLLLEENCSDITISENLISPELQTFKTYLQDLRNGIEVKLRENANQAKEREKSMRLCQYKNEQAQKDITAIEEELKKKKTELNAAIIGKNIMINRYQNKIQSIETGAKETFVKREKTINDEIEKLLEESRQAEMEMNNELEGAKHRYDSLLKEHLAIENKLRAQRTKVENQLLAMIQKFDEDMQEKQLEEEECQKSLNEDKAKVDQIQSLIDEQADEYDELMQEKAAEEQEILEQKQFLFVLNRSARRIQRGFLAYKLKMLTKKKGKGRKGKKK